jgi:hypothetical protein
MEIYKINSLEILMFLVKPMIFNLVVSFFWLLPEQQSDQILSLFRNPLRKHRLRLKDLLKRLFLVLPFKRKISRVH